MASFLEIRKRYHVGRRGVGRQDPELLLEVRLFVHRFCLHGCADAELTDARQIRPPMKDQGIQPKLFIRGSSLTPFTGFLDGIGAPVFRCLTHARFTMAVLEEPEMLIPPHITHRSEERPAAADGIDDHGNMLWQAGRSGTTHNPLNSFKNIRTSP